MLSYEQRAHPMPHRMPYPDLDPQSRGAVSSSLSSSSSSSSSPKADAKHIWVITGPAGCGKSTVAQHLAEQLSLPYVEGDEFHPQANIDKMAAGIPLTDADRWDWLITLRQKSVADLHLPHPSSTPAGVVLTCSALKRKYRDVMRVAAYNEPSVKVHFVYLRASEELLLSRVRARQGHYMKDSMVKSQFASLEEPTEDETDCLVVNVGGTMPEVQALALDAVKQALVPTVHAETFS